LKQNVENEQKKVDNILDPRDMKASVDSILDIAEKLNPNTSDNAIKEEPEESEKNSGLFGGSKHSDDEKDDLVLIS
jgi:hypothetical protein